VIVGVGVFLEFAEHLPIRMTRFNAHGWLVVRHNLGRWKKRAEWISTTVVLIGLTGEGLFEGLTSRADNILQTFNEVLIGNAQLQASDADNLARQYESQIAQAQRDAANAKAQAAASDLARLQLEASIAWRRLTKEQISEIGLKLSAFPRQLTALVYNNGDLEAYSFACDIDVALHEVAKWNVGEPQPIVVMREGPVPFGTNPPLERGVVVISTADEGSRNAARTLIHELNSRGFDATRGAQQSRNPRPTVEIFVEPRPEGPQGKFKLAAQKKAHEQK